jgi:hypothetical protein
MCLVPSSYWPNGEDYMNETTSNIKRNIETTREAMTEKILLLEHRIQRAVIVPRQTMDLAIDNIDQIKSTMEETRSSIDYGLETLSQSVEETIVKVEAIAEHLVQMGRNPWLLLSSAILLGFAVGTLNQAKLVDSYDASTQAEETY